MRVTNLKINGIQDPRGFLYEKLLCSWKVEDTKSRQQVNAVIEVSSSRRFEDMIYRKEGAGLKQRGERLEMELKPRTTYYYRVKVKGDDGDQAVSETACFETGKMNEEWSAWWISPKRKDSFHPVFRKEFTVGKPIKRARLYVSGVGLFEAYLNGKKLGEEFLTPYLTHYETNIQAITFPMEEQLKTENCLEVILGKGWYMGTFGLEQQKENFGDRMALIAEVHLEYEDGSSECIITDESWSYYGSDIAESGIYFGEILDRTLFWGKENKEQQAEILLDMKKEHLMDRLSLPVKAKEEIRIKEVLQTPNGETVLDMGQNFAGFIEFLADFEKGTRIELEFGEILQNGNFYNGNYRDAESRFVYISNGKAETVRPHFTFYGFRYVRVSGWPGRCEAKAFTGRVLYSDIPRTGYLETGNARINRLYENTVCGLKSNFLDIPTDCPQRSERLGWTGDAQVFAATACYHMDNRAFFHKFIKDLRDEQKMLDGGVPNYFPNIGHKKDVGSVWGDIATFLPDVLYSAYGEIEEMEYCYPLMKEWVDFIDREDGKRGERKYLFDFGFHFGDWLALDGVKPTSFKGSTDDDYIASVYYYRSAQIVKEMSVRLGRQAEAHYYAELEEKIKQAVQYEYFTPAGRLAVDTQAAYVIAIKFGIAPDREMIIRQFKKRLKKDCYQIKCGFVGAPLLCTALAEAGLYELAYDFLLKEGFPGWLYSVDLGATTIWERWNSVLPDGTISDTGMNSLNHYAYGSVMEFVYAYGAGIRAGEAGFKKAIIEPHPDIRLKKLRCQYDSVNGMYVSSWEIEADGKLNIHIEIPFNCEAEVRLPQYEKETLMLAAGSYDFDYYPKQSYKKPYSRNTTLARLAADEEAMAIIRQYVPMIAGMAASKDPEALADTLDDFSKKTYLPIDQKQLECAIVELSEKVV